MLVGLGMLSVQLSTLTLKMTQVRIQRLCQVGLSWQYSNRARSSPPIKQQQSSANSNFHERQIRPVRINWRLSISRPVDNRARPFIHSSLCTIPYFCKNAMSIDSIADTRSWPVYASCVLSQIGLQSSQHLCPMYRSPLLASNTTPKPLAPASVLHVDYP